MSIEEKYDEVRELILMGKERGYLLYDEVNDLLPEGICSSDELDSIFSLFGTAGIEVIDSEQKFQDEGKKDDKQEDAGEEFDFGSIALDKTTGPDVPAGNGDGSPAEPRGRSRDRETNRARPESGIEGSLPVSPGRA